MQILVISNLYPPYSIGGYELICADVVVGLRGRGHNVTVLTSSPGLLPGKRDSNVLRLLKGRFPYQPCSNIREVVQNIWNRFILQIVVKIFKPEIIYVFNPNGLGGLVLDWLHSQPISVVHDIMDTALISIYQSDIWFKISKKNIKSPFKRGLSSIIVNLLFPFIKTKFVPLDLSNSCFRSNFLKQWAQSLGGNVKRAPVIYPGIHLLELRPSEKTPKDLGIVFSGRLSFEKGVHMLLEALLLNKQLFSRLGIKTTIIGPITNLDYWRRLQNLAYDLTPEISIHFTKLVPHREAIKLLKEHSIFVFPVLWDEPFGLAPLEAMGAGLAVIATCTGGSAEFMKNEENCLAVSRGSSQGLAEALKRLIFDKELRLRLARAGQETAAKFTIEKSINLVEKHLQEVRLKA